MDPWAVRAVEPYRTALCWSNSINQRVGSYTVLEIKVSPRNFSLASYSYGRSLVIKTMAKKNDDSSSSFGKDDRSVPEGDGSKGNDPSDSSKSRDSASQKPYRVNMDWREFRANLFRQEQMAEVDSDGHNNLGRASPEVKPLGFKWAHPIPVPETGCVLVATEKLDGIQTFERTVVLLLRSGSGRPREGPFGVVINHPLHKRMRHMKPTNNNLSSIFADCSLHFGGPLEASMFMVKTTGNRSKAKLPGFEEIVPGLGFGSRNSLDEAAALVKKGILKPQDFRFFVGYAGWHYDQLREEIESEYWHVAACSSSLICGALSESLWEEILQLMGGHYSDLSRKPRPDM